MPNDIKIHIEEQVIKEIIELQQKFPNIKLCMYQNLEKFDQGEELKIKDKYLKSLKFKKPQEEIKK